MEEWLDIVDELDCVIGRDTRARVHAAGQFHRSSHILLFNTSGQVFVQLRSMGKDSNPGLWDTSAAGHVDSGESYAECAIRELQEELGIDVNANDLTLIDKLPPDSSNGFEFTTIYTAYSDQSLALQAEEIDEGRWLTPKELEVWMERRAGDFTEVFRKIWYVCDQAGL